MAKRVDSPPAPPQVPELALSAASGEAMSAGSASVWLTDTIIMSFNVEAFGNLTRCDTFTWHGYLEAHRLRRAYFKQHGATSTDHGHVSAQTVDLPQADAPVRSGAKT